jgi:acyl-coenzyme A synthetase/AMP-(fatty) acid ligase
VIIAVAEGVGPEWTQEVNTRLSTLSKHKQPRIMLDFDVLPRNPQGKISRKKVRDLVLSHYELLDGPYPTVQPLAGNKT